MKDRTGEVWIVNEGGAAEVVGLVVSKNEEESGYGAVWWNVYHLAGWSPGDVSTWGESEAGRNPFEKQPGMRRIA